MKISVPTAVSSGENLVNFINNASSSVKTVLSKPSCFKRNTNHRRFLQKQLRQSVQQQSETTTIPTTPNTLKVLKTSDSKENTISKIEKLLADAKAKKEQDKKEETKTKTLKQKTIRKKRRMNPIRTTHNLPPPGVVIPSPTTEYADRHEFEYEPMAFSDYQKIQKEYVSDRVTVPSPTYANYYPTYPSLYPTHYYRTNSTSSYASSEEDFGFGDFLSGEDLMRNLEFGDLFIPDYTNELHKNEMIYRSIVENERHLQYLAQLEALEATYCARENDLLSQHQNSISDST